VAYQATYTQVATQVRLGKIDVLNVDSHRVGAFAAALMSIEYAARVETGNGRYHRTLG
jgi:hypothetical protein